MFVSKVYLEILNGCCLFIIAACSKLTLEGQESISLKLFWPLTVFDELGVRWHLINTCLGKALFCLVNNKCSPLLRYHQPWHCLLYLPPPTLPSYFCPPLLYFSVVSCSSYFPAQDVNPSYFSSLRAPIKKGLASVICQTIVPSLRSSSSTLTSSNLSILPKLWEIKNKTKLSWSELHLLRMRDKE